MADGGRGIYGDGGGRGRHGRNVDEEKERVDGEEVEVVRERARETLRDKYGVRRLFFGDTSIGKLKVVDMNRLWTLFVALPVLGMFIAGYLLRGNPSFMLVFSIIGGFVFLPVGVVVGSVVSSPELKCKILRRIQSDKNYGVVQILSRGGRITKRVKDLDDDLLFVDDQVWPVQDSKIYSYDSDPYMSPIESQHMRKEPGDVPTLFVDLESVQPVSFNKSETEIIPQQLAANITGWVQTQVQKRVHKKMQKRDIALAILGVGVVIAAFLAFRNYQTLNEEIMPLLKQLAP